MTRRVLLLGAGHAHLHTLRHAGAFHRRGIELVAVAPEPFWYSGLATGMLGGTYPAWLDQVDIAALLGREGRFIQDLATKVDPARRTVHLQEGAPLRYDVLSLNLGSVAPAIPGAAGSYAVKPIHRLHDLRLDLEARFRAAPRIPVRVVVAGGGITAVELAANMAALAAKRGGQIALTVLAGRDRVLDRLRPLPAARLVRTLERRGIRFWTGSRVDRVEKGTAVLNDGRRVGFDLFINATGLVPAPLIREIGLPVDAAGALRVDRHLRSIADPRVFGGGDGIALEGRALPRIGVHAIRQGPVLFANLLATLAGGPLQRFCPQRRYLWIMNLGDGSGFAGWDGLWWQGRAAFWVKDRIDRRFLRTYRREPAKAA